MELFKLIAIAFVCALFTIVLKNTKPELAFVTTLSGAIILMIAALDQFSGVFSLLNDLSKLTGIDSKIVKLLLKIVGVGYLTEFSSDILNDFGANSIASKVELCGKITILLLASPIIKMLVAVIVEFLNLYSV